MVRRKGLLTEADLATDVDVVAAHRSVDTQLQGELRMKAFGAMGSHRRGCAETRGYDRREKAWKVPVGSP